MTVHSPENEAQSLGDERSSESLQRLDQTSMSADDPVGRNRRHS